MPCTNLFVAKRLPRASRPLCMAGLTSAPESEPSDQLPVCVLLQVHSNGPVLDDEILADPAVQECIENETSLDKSFNIYNVDRACLGRVGGSIAKLHGDSGFAGSLNLNITVSLLPREPTLPSGLSVSMLLWGLPWGGCPSTRRLSASCLL